MKVNIELMNTTMDYLNLTKELHEFKRDTNENIKTVMNVL